MQVSVEKVSDVERRLTIVIPANQIDQAYDNQINRLAKSANLHGFRPGKAPIAVIKQRFGDDARKEAMSQVIQNALYEAIEKNNLKPVSTPRIEPKVASPDQPLEFIASFEVLPEIGKVNCVLANIEKLIVDIKEDDVKRVIEQLQKQYTKWKVVDRAATIADRVVIDYYAIFEGKSDLENKVTDFPLELGGKVMLPGFEDGLVGAKASDERTLNLNFPSDFSVAEKAGKAVDFVVQVKQVFEAEMPEVNEQFIKQLGVKSGDAAELKMQINRTLEQERDRLVKEKLKEQIFGQVLEQNPIEVPKSLIAREAKNIHDEIYPHQHDHHHHSDSEMNTFNEIAKKRVALGLLIAEFAKQANLNTDKDKVKQRIEEIAAQYENPNEVIAWLSSDEHRSGIEAQVMEDQVIDKLLEGVSVTEKIISYAELKGIRI